MSISTFSIEFSDRDRLIKAAFEGKSFRKIPVTAKRELIIVGAALLITTGEIIKGANIENASYGGTICAERTAFVKAVSEGKRSFTGLAVVTDVKSAISPCGMCRQVIREFCAQTMPILLVPADYEQRLAEGVADGGVKETSIGELLPDSFGPEDLDRPRA
ncbi:hypothetical protein BN946_scf185012.g9 [Trametes cinnabarina]|uniref:cytidine deaminase n=1 Tax=Pycnoporus cinnabarinus TaxID=5643 RepID=A0A060SLK8_PYCCI|nr:hypothetical protein BN946_scf185012.g9 [Trametes cinnabarina]